MIGGRLNLRVRIDGIEVPAIGARVSAPEGGPATAEIHVIPTEAVYDILPRAFIEVYYYDSYGYERNPVFETGALLYRTPLDPRRWKFLFAGEYVALGFTKVASGRQAVIQAVDPTNYWDFIKQHYLNFSTGGVEFFENAFLGIKLDRIKNYDVPGADLTSNIYRWLTQSKGTDGKPNIYLGVQRILREMWFASNDFYARAFNRLRIGDQIVGIPGDETAAKLFNLEFFEKFIKGQIGGGGGPVDLRSVIGMLLGPVFHNYTTVAAPWFDRFGRARGFSPSSTSSQDARLLEETIGRSKSWPEGCLNYTIIKPDAWFLMPPACNVLFPHQYQSVQFNRGLLQEPTRLFMRTQLLFGGGADAWLTERFFCPDFETFNQLLYKEGGYLSRLAGTVLKHENFVGINPVETWVPDITAYVQKGARREYLARMGDYLFWKYRFNSRTASISGHFNPHVVPGFPGVIIDNPGTYGKVVRHLIGNVGAVTHTITQEGGMTHISLVGAHVHDETADFDDKGRSLEDVTARGTDGFLDNRYDPERIGPEVYQVLFGTDSIYEVAKQYLLSGEIAAEVGTISEAVNTLFATQGKVAASVGTLQLLYQLAVQENANLESFTQSIVNRPHANLVEMAGVAFTGSPEVISADDSFAATQEGFFVSATDPLAETTKNATFKATTKRQIPVTVTTLVPPVTSTIGEGGSQKTIILQGEKTEISTVYKTIEDGTTGNYELSSHVEARQEQVRSYLNTLVLRGIRG